MFKSIVAKTSILNTKNARSLTKAAVNKTRELLNNENAKFFFKVIAENTGAVQKSVKEPTLINFLLAGSGILNSVYNAFDMHSSEYFETGGWEYVLNSTVTNLFLPVLQKSAHDTDLFAMSDKQTHVKTFSCNDGDLKLVFGCLIFSNGNVSHLYVQGKTEVARAKNFLCQIFWGDHHDHSILITSQRIQSRWHDDDTSLLHAVEDKYVESMPSAHADKQTRNIKRALAHGIHRAILYYGPPGTGKSTLCRSIISQLAMTSVRIRYNDLANNADMWGMISTLEADAIIIDDIDRCETQRLLELLENLQKSTKLVLATANSRNSIDEACLRPGRFDELVHIKQLDAAVVKHVLGDDLSLEGFDTVKEWPIAFIQEYKKRRTYMSHDEALETMKELQERVERLSCYDEDDLDGDGFNKLFEGKPRSKKKKKNTVPPGW